MDLARHLDFTLIAFAEGDDRGENQPVVERLDVGTPIEIKGVAGREEPWGHGVFFVCRVMPDGTKFDLPIRHAKLIGITDPVLAKQATLFDPRTIRQ